MHQVTAVQTVVWFAWRHTCSTHGHRVGRRSPAPDRPRVGGHGPGEGGPPGTARVACFTATGAGTAHQATCMAFNRGNRRPVYIGASLPGNTTVTDRTRRVKRLPVRPALHPGRVARGRPETARKVRRFSFTARYRAVRSRRSTPRWARCQSPHHAGRRPTRWAGIPANGHRRACWKGLH